MMTRLLTTLLFSGLLEDALKVVAGLVLAVALAQAFAVSSLAALLGTVVPGGGLGGAGAAVIPPDQQAIFEAAGSGCGLPWQALAAITQVQGVSQGATGPAALTAISGELCALGGGQDLRGALLRQTVQDNRDPAFVDQVLVTAARYGYLAPGSRDAQVVDLARAEIGVPYLWGGASPTPGFDCSGLVQWVYRQVGVALPRTAQQQFDATARLAPDDLRPGDLTFFQICCQPPDIVTHVGIYVGNGQMIHAPTEGQFVRQESINTPYWLEHWAGAGRVLAQGQNEPR